ncbi:4-alpha-glucanotransferase [Acholeplasma oculi]|uniref:4-alpha-glucanotransferase n=1 Tax=Acholeplasma oculi TaxID=35623 RepID=A0A061AA70_9MOLU|nr:4-alpha-glucanotransferase [Acholeplasma oculi]CDR30800.1 putative 4-alpha-glucanotransferase [Acholeplasma oculi]SKC35024.1 4-alpha-glucanotransferase [Acholeplasma oculi]SUT89773.1 4-alpha-glucanotransferase [Acholeplasma oculi]
MRKAGILLHISSLPSKYGIGTFGKEAYKFVDFLQSTHQSYWQILPLGPTSYGDSPYQTFSAFAMNPYFIDLDILVQEKLLKKSEILDSTSSETHVDFERLYHERFIVLRSAYNRFDKTDSNYIEFLRNESYWLPDYALFMALKASHDGKSWMYWSEAYRLREKEAIEKAYVTHQNEIEFHYFLQFKAYQQWYRLKTYANQKGIEFIGDMPIYVSYDSSDVWTKPQYFQLDENKMPTLVAGVPPDNFSQDGQLWGNPLYRWDVLEKDYYSWWIDRVRSNTYMFDLLRIDHFIGFVNYFGIPFGDKTARNGVWYKGPGQKLFDAIKWQLGDKRIIAEDLGAITDEVRALLQYTGFPGMKLLQFAFDSREESDYIPHLYTKNVIAYTGTHDNETTEQWFKKLPPRDLKYCLDYINHQKGSKTDSLIKATLASIANDAIIPMQDYLNLGSEARFNIPSTLGGNWVWRLKPTEIDRMTKMKIKRFTHLYGRDAK